MEEELEALADSSRRSKETLQETFQRLYPYYMAIGMSYDEYWNDEAILVKYYRKAHLYKSKQRNEELWLEGLYTYHAVATALGNGFRKKGSQPTPYLEKPIALNSLEIKEQREAEEKKKLANILKYVKGNLKFHEGDIPKG